MKSTRQTQKELQEAYQNNPRIKQIFEELADKSKSESMNANGAYVFTKYKQNNLKSKSLLGNSSDTPQRDHA